MSNSVEKSADQVGERQRVYQFSETGRKLLVKLCGVVQDETNPPSIVHAGLFVQYDIGSTGGDLGKAAENMNANILEKLDPVNRDLKAAFESRFSSICAGEDAVKEHEVIEGVVDEFRDDEATVVLDVDGERVFRFMDSAELRQAGVTEEGQGFELHAEEGVREGTLSLTTWIKPLPPPPAVPRVDLFPELDLTKFRRRGGQS